MKTLIQLAASIAITAYLIWPCEISCHECNGPLGRWYPRVVAWGLDGCYVHIECFWKSHPVPPPPARP